MLGCCGDEVEAPAEAVAASEADKASAATFSDLSCTIFLIESLLPRLLGECLRAVKIQNVY